MVARDLNFSRVVKRSRPSADRTLDRTIWSAACVIAACTDSSGRPVSFATPFNVRHLNDALESASSTLVTASLASMSVIFIPRCSAQPHVAEHSESRSSGMRREQPYDRQQPTYSHQTTLPARSQKWDRHPRLRWIEGSSVTRPRLSSLRRHRGDAPLKTASWMPYPQPHGHRMPTQTSSPFSDARTILPGGSSLGSVSPSMIIKFARRVRNAFA